MIKQQIYNTIAYSGIWFLNKFFPEYFAAEPLKPTDRYIEYPFVIRNLPPPPAKVLDVGCSGSMFPLILNALGYKTYGMDIRKYYPVGDFFFINGDICNAPIADNLFDIVTAISSIEHIGIKGVYGQQENIDGDIQALKEIHRILKPKGILIMTVPYGERLKIELNHKIYTHERLSLMLKDFRFRYALQKSPEANYDIALIIATK